LRDHRFDQPVRAKDNITTCSQSRRKPPMQVMITISFSPLSPSFFGRGRVFVNVWMADDAAGAIPHR